MTSHIPPSPPPLVVWGPEVGPCVVAGPAVGPEVGPCVVAGPAVGPEVGPCVVAGPAVGPEVGPCVVAGPAVGPEVGPAVLGPGGAVAVTSQSTFQSQSQVLEFSSNTVPLGQFFLMAFPWTHQ